MNIRKKSPLFIPMAAAAMLCLIPARSKAQEAVPAFDVAALSKRIASGQLEQTINMPECKQTAKFILLHIPNEIIDVKPQEGFPFSVTTGHDRAEKAVSYVTSTVDANYSYETVSKVGQIFTAEAQAIIDRAKKTCFAHAGEQDALLRKPIHVTANVGTMKAVL